MDAWRLNVDAAGRRLHSEHSSVCERRVVLGSSQKFSYVVFGVAGFFFLRKNDPLLADASLRQPCS